MSGYVFFGPLAIVNKPQCLAAARSTPILVGAVNCQGMMGKQIARLGWKGDFRFQVGGGWKIGNPLTESKRFRTAMLPQPKPVGTGNIAHAAVFLVDLLQCQPHRDRLARIEHEVKAVLMGWSRLPYSWRFVEVLHILWNHWSAQHQFGHLAEDAVILPATEVGIMLSQLLYLLERGLFVGVFIVDVLSGDRRQTVANESGQIRMNLGNFVFPKESLQKDVAVIEKILPYDPVLLQSTHRNRFPLVVRFFTFRVPDRNATEREKEAFDQARWASSWALSDNLHPMLFDIITQKLTCFLRDALENCAAEEAAQHITEQQLAVLESIQAQMESIQAEISACLDGHATPELMHRWLDCEEEFHEVLVGAARNSLLSKGERINL